MRELLALDGGLRIDVHMHAKEQEGFRLACHQGHLAVVSELLALDGNRRIDVHAEEEEGFRLACRHGQLGVVRELLALKGDRSPSLQHTAAPLRELLSAQLQYASLSTAPSFLALVRACSIPEPSLEAAMKHACVRQAYDGLLPETQYSATQACFAAASVITNHVLLHPLQRTPVSHGIALLTPGACPAVDALALCAVLPGAECRHPVGELGGCGAAVPGGGAGRSIGDAFGGYYRACGWRGVPVPVDGCVSAEGAGADAGVGALLHRGCRRVPLLMRSSSRAAGK